MSRAALVVLAFASLLTAPRSVSAQEREDAASLASPLPPTHHDASQFALDVTAFTTLPIAVGGAVALEMPGHVVLRFSAGAVPDAYVDAINDVGTSWGAYGESDAAVASTLLGGATYLELALGIRPAGTPGIELSVGYVMLWSHRITGMSLVGGSGDRALGLDMTIDAVHAELAYQAELSDHVYFRIALGWAHAVAHGVSLSTERPDDATRAMITQAETALNDTIGRYAFGPTLGGALGARF